MISVRTSNEQLDPEQRDIGTRDRVGQRTGGRCIRARAGSEPRTRQMRRTVSYPDQRMTYERIADAVRAAGFACRGGFRPNEADAVPPMPGGEPVATLVVVGNAGNAMWSAFRALAHAARTADPLDYWTRDILAGVAQHVGARALFPFTGPPFHPFQRWALRAEPVWPSPIGPLVHPEYGLWHAYRGALAFVERVSLAAQPPASNPCETCVERPCLTTCPVGAFTEGGYDVPACVGHLGDPAGDDCLATGCRARR